MSWILQGDLTDPQTWEDFLLGAATAGIMNAPATIANNVAINNYGKNLDVDYRDYSEGIDTDQTHYTNPADAKEAQGFTAYGRRVCRYAEAGQIC